MIFLLYHTVRKKKHETNEKTLFVYFFLRRILSFLAMARPRESE